MADQATGAATGVAGKAQGATGAVSGAKGAASSTAAGLSNKVKGATDGILGSIEGFGSWIAAKGKAMLDRFFPPEQRAALLARLQAFMLANPQLSAFLGMNLALTGVPLFLFILFSLVVFIFSLLVGIIVSVLSAVLFTIFCIGIALTIVLPVVMFTTGAACFLFLWGLGGYYILKWANSDKPNQPTPEGGAVGDKLNSLTGGRLTGFIEAAKTERAKGDITGFNDQHTKTDAGHKAQPSGSAHTESKPQHVEHAQKEKEAGETASKATKASGIEHAYAKKAA